MLRDQDAGGGFGVQASQRRDAWGLGCSELQDTERMLEWNWHAWGVGCSESIACEKGCRRDVQRKGIQEECFWGSGCRIGVWGSGCSERDAAGKGCRRDPQESGYRNDVQGLGCSKVRRDDDLKERWSGAEMLGNWVAQELPGRRDA